MPDYSWSRDARSQLTADEAAKKQDEATQQEKDTEQWVTQFNAHLLLTVQAIHRLHLALSEKMPMK